MMKRIVAGLVLLLPASGAYAPAAPLDVPEAGAAGSIAALAAVATVGAIAWERRRRNRKD